MTGSSDPPRDGSDGSTQGGSNILARQLKINGHTWMLNRDGTIELFGDEHNPESRWLAADELCYVLQEFQNTFGGIPVKADLSEWRGVYGEPG